MRPPGGSAARWDGCGLRPEVLATVFVIRDSRKREVAIEILGAEPSGVVVTDRYTVYLFVAMDRHQVCLAHLMRDFLSMAEGEAEHQWLGERLHGLLGAVFRVWHRFKDGDIDRATLQRWCPSIRTRMLELLDQGALSSGYRTPGMCRGILKTEPAMWTFVHHEGVEPTNNTGERAVRPGVLLRKSSLGTQSERGNRYVERMRTVATTLKRAGRSVSEYVIEVSHSVLRGTSAPALLQ
jgi:transposase